MSEIKLSEIRARAEEPFPSDTHRLQLDINHLLDLVKRMKKRLKPPPFSACGCESCEEARALLKETEL